MTRRKPNRLRENASEDSRGAAGQRRLKALSPTTCSTTLAASTARNRAILWVLYDTGIRVSELCGLRLGDFDRKHGVLTVTGKGSKERRIALGSNCLRNLLYYLDRYRPDEDELAEWGSADEDHLFLSETRLPLTKNGVTLLFKRIKKRAGITDKRIRGKLRIRVKSYHKAICSIARRERSLSKHA